MADPLSLLFVTFLDVAFSAHDLSVFRVVRPTLGPGNDMIDVGLVLGGVTPFDQGLLFLGETSARPSSSHNFRR
ncbi:hypothetical protein SYV04_43135 [Hyalangium sp. s54d21]|uniref:Secreted protein n=1 Tax=Hyalangium rubrum TaxID=3103134 RepID=A0ABU5HMB8_9BACT|nr:hypothetical protein [Hyalangium sp. s54d21]